MRCIKPLAWAKYRSWPEYMHLTQLFIVRKMRVLAGIRLLQFLVSFDVHEINFITLVHETHFQLHIRSFWVYHVFNIFHLLHLWLIDGQWKILFIKCSQFSVAFFLFPSVRKKTSSNHLTISNHVLKYLRKWYVEMMLDTNMSKTHLHPNIAEICTNLMNSD